MRVCLVQFHPLEDSYNSALLAAAERGLRGHDIARFRLAEHAGPSPTDLEAATALVAVHPTWWGGLPAQLLHWVQATLGPWIDGPAPPGPSPLRHVGHLVVVTSHGSPRWINALQGEPGRQLWARRVAPLCSPGTRLDWQSLYNIDRAPASARAGFLTHVESHLAGMSPVTSGPARG